MIRRELVLVLFLCGVLAANGNSREPFSLQLVGGGGRCQGQLQVQWAGQDWTGVSPLFVPLWLGNRLCAEVDCGSILNVVEKTVPSRAAVIIYPDRCDNTSLISCFTPVPFDSHWSLELSCSDSVRLDKGLCSGSLQFRGQSSDRSLDQSWTGVCEGALDHRGAEVVCRELGCGPPVLQGALSPPVLQGALSPLGQMFHCEGQESALIDCPQNLTDIHREKCSTLQLSCAEPVRLVGGSSRCEGVVEMKHRGEWRRVMSSDLWTLEAAAAVCRDLDCGSAVSTERRDFNRRPVWSVKDDCVKAATVRSCVFDGEPYGGPSGLKVVCSESVPVPPASADPSPAAAPELPPLLLPPPGHQGSAEGRESRETQRP